ncbi:hypothetical protein HDU85_002468 [Gaertneriomyces sp. JEL0708]|nr:hypothetical protein HDU85_002468 [Gaertneriomyces sp. JEL0708]
MDVQDINRVILVGNVGADPEFRAFPSENNKPNDERPHGVFRFNIATNSRFKTREGEFVTDTQWHRVSAYGSYLPELISKGTKVLVEGRLGYWKTEDGKSGADIHCKTGDVKFISEPRGSYEAHGEYSPRKQ